MKSALLYFLAVHFCLNVFAQNADEVLIREVMSKQEIAWNNGDLSTFMQGYMKSDSILFVGSNGPKYGWNSALEHYKKGYPDTAAMGKLRFDILQCKPLSTEYYFVLGSWHLTRSMGNVRGPFTLLFRKLKSGWYIVADHSSVMSTRKCRLNYVQVKCHA